MFAALIFTIDVRNKRMEQLFHQLKQLRLGHAATALTLQQEQPGTYHDFV